MSNFLEIHKQQRKAKVDCKSYKGYKTNVNFVHYSRFCLFCKGLLLVYVNISKTARVSPIDQYLHVLQSLP